jgi:ammonia channel protein AmtB
MIFKKGFLIRYYLLIIAGSIGGVTWIVADMIKNKSKKISLIGFCNGAVVGKKIYFIDFL